MVRMVGQYMVHDGSYWLIMVTIYNNGYNNGFNNGYNKGYNNGRQGLKQCVIVMVNPGIFGGFHMIFALLGCLYL